ncbi:MAG TPA: phosphoglycolate phosphatase [Thermoplasmata archaeon]|nr:phosphoglycolate phosphatase [Thermoplasmata archaeon]
MTPPGAGRSARPPVRALITDVDGTLTDRSRRLDPAAVRAVRGVEDLGIPVLLATGNVLPIALALHRSLGLSGPVVAENGGILYTEGPGGPRVERMADRRVALRALRRLRAQGLAVRPLFTDRWRETEVALEPGVSVRNIREALRGMPVDVEATGFAVHLIEKGIGKLSTVEVALRRMGASVSECAALGDGDNDVRLLEAAGRSVSFRTGSAAARRAAGYVSHAPYARGFVEGLIHLGLVPRSVRSERSSRAGR